MPDDQPTKATSSTIQDFCARHDMGISTLYALRKRGLAPKLMKMGRVNRITDAAEREWIERMEARADGGAA